MGNFKISWMLFMLSILTVQSEETRLIFSGGNGGYQSVYVFNPYTKESCQLPSLGYNYGWHTQDGAIICGNQQRGDTKSCVTFSAGSWVVTHQLMLGPREGHMSWVSDQGIVLMGGEFGKGDRTEIVPVAGGTSQEHFRLKYDTRYACTITDNQKGTVVLIGGQSTRNFVTEYNHSGFVQDLATLNVGRKNPGCGAYYENGKKIWIVTGGDRISSTEILREGEFKWTKLDSSSDLPKVMRAGSSSTVMDNVVYVSGGCCSYDDTIWAWEPIEMKWITVGSYGAGKEGLGMSSIPMKDVEGYLEGCNGKQVASPTQSPTQFPTSSPTQSPTSSPTPRNTSCLTFIDWKQMLLNAQVLQPKLEILFDKEGLNFEIAIELDYLGDSADGLFDPSFNLGTTYVVDFSPMNRNEFIYNNTGSCSNRMASSYIDRDISTYWQYSDTPNLPGHLKSQDYLAYPPVSKFWTLTSGTTCKTIKYTGTFTWSDLVHCNDGDGKQLFSIEDNADTLKIRGTLYVSVVSPYSTVVANYADYRVFPLITKEFGSNIHKMAHIISSNGADIQLFRGGIYGFSFNKSSSVYTFTVLTTTADFLILSNPELRDHQESVQAGSMWCTDSNFLCYQFWQVQFQSSCPTNFANSLKFDYRPDCRLPESSENSFCTSFENENGAELVQLEMTNNYDDDSCDPIIFTVAFEGVITFYDDVEFTQVHDQITSYLIGSTMYVSVSVTDIVAITMQSVTIENVWVCSSNDSANLISSLSSTTGLGGCFSKYADSNGTIQLSPGDEYSTVYHSMQSADTNIATFSFTVFGFPRLMYVQLQLRLSLGVQNNGRKLLQEVTTEQTRHYMISVNVEEGSTNANAEGSITVEAKNYYTMILAVVVPVACFFLIAFVVFFIRAKGKKVQLSNGGTI